jgi:alginate O-acetyltransferase complex protein AlgI
MVFTSFQFLIFFVAALALLVILPPAIGSFRPRRWLLVLASYGFYAFWDWRFPALLLVSTLASFYLGKRIYRSQESSRRKLWLSISVVISLGLLGFFKYYNFFVDSISAVLSGWGLALSHLDIILPVGISFYSFQAISYTVDLYRGRQQPVDNLLDYTLFMTFFPKLIAGPLVRTRDFFPQLQNPIHMTGANLWAGSQIFIVGLFKKLMIAEAVAPFVNAVYDYPEYYSSPTVWLAVVAYALQIYCDFSGYSDMAIGSARILGFDLGRNFDMPYLSRNVQEFWRRWHISLSSWLRDYLYIPLGGNRRGRFRTYLNSLITMVLGGLWHGASWNFVIWGAAHGIALVVHRLWSNRVRSKAEASGQGNSQDRTPVLVQILSTAATLLFVTLAWVLFRAQDMGTARSIYSKLMFIDAGGAQWYYQAALAAIGWTILGHVGGKLRQTLDKEHGHELVFFRTPYSFVAAFTVVLTLLIIYIFAPITVSPFIYFQF